MKKAVTIVIVMSIIMGMFIGTVNAVSASVKAKASTVTNGNTVTVTVSFGQKVRTAQFNLNFDSSKLEFISNSAGVYSSNTKKCSYNSSTGTEDISSISFKFKAKAVGQASVSVSGLRISHGEQSGASVAMGNSSTSITIKKKTTTKPTTNNTTKKEEETKPALAPNELIKLDNKGIKTLKDDRTNIMVKGIEIAIDDGVILEVKNIDENEKNYEILEEILKNVEGNKIYFDINLLKDEVKVQPNGYVTVCIPISEECEEDNVKMYYLDEENKKYELVEGEIQTLKKEITQIGEIKEVEENYYTFITNHFSIYALVEEKEIPNEIENIQVVAPIEDAKVEQKDMIQMILEFLRNPIVLCVIIVILLIIVIIQRIKISGQKAE